MSQESMTTRFSYSRKLRLDMMKKINLKQQMETAKQIKKDKANIKSIESIIDQEYLNEENNYWAGM